MKGKRFWKYWWVICCISVLLMGPGIVSCTGDDNDDDGPTGIVMPLSIGNSWTYSYNSAQIGTGTFTMKGTGTQTVLGVEATRIDYSGSFYDGMGYWILLRNDSDGLNFYGDAFNGIVNLPDLWCKYPCSTGDTWQTSGQGAVVNWVVISTDETITVNGVSYSTIHVTGVTQGSGSVAEHWWALNIGEVKFEVTMAGATLSGELLSYTIL